MPITPTPKIWMNGELVDWDKAQIHVLTHTLHYGTGVFEGIRAYETSQGPAVFRLTDHIVRLHNSAKILGMEIPYTRRRAGRGDQGDRGLDRPAARATSARSPTSATARWGSTRCRARSTWRSPAGRGAPTSATTPSTKGVRMKISSWTRHDHNTMPPASKTTGNYVNSSLAKVEALKAGYDEAIMLAPNGLVAECTGENIFVVPQRHPDHAAAVGRGAGGHHPELGDDDRRRPRHRLPGRQHRPQRPVHRRGDLRLRHGRRDQLGQLGRRPRRSPAPARRPRPSPRSTPAPSAARSRSTRTGASSPSDRQSSAPSQTRRSRRRPGARRPSRCRRRRSRRRRRAAPRRSATRAGSRRSRLDLVERLDRRAVRRRSGGQRPSSGDVESQTSSSGRPGSMWSTPAGLVRTRAPARRAASVVATTDRAADSSSPPAAEAAAERRRDAASPPSRRRQSAHRPRRGSAAAGLLRLTKMSVER